MSRQEDRDRIRARACNRALRRLARTYPAEFREMLNEERRGLGLPDVKEQRPAACGTRSGANRHRRCGEAVCAGCLAADAAYAREYVRRSRFIKPVLAHGTLTGYVQYRCRCGPCRTRYEQYASERRQA